MKKFLVILMVIAMASFLFVGCIPGVTPVDEDEEEDEEPVVPTTVAPIITSVPVAADGYVNAAEAADGIVVNGTAPTYSEVKVYINGITAGTGDSGVNGVFQVVVAKADLEKSIKVDGAKTLYATATEAGLAESASSNEIKFTLDTAAPKIASVKARGGTPFFASATITYQTFPSPPQDIDMFTVELLDTGAQLPTGTTKWKVEILSITWILTIPNNLSITWKKKNTSNTGIFALDLITVRVHNLTTGTFIDYEFNDAFINPVTSSEAWIPGTTTTVNDPFESGNGLNSVFHVGAYALITTVKTGAIPGRVSLTYNEDVSWTQAVTLGNYTIYNNSTGYDVLTGAPLFLAGTGNVFFMAYNETADTMFWTEPTGTGLEGVDLTQGQWLTFQVDSVADVAGNSILVGSPETANCTILAPTVAIGP